MKRSNIDAMICRQEKITDITRETINKIQLDKLNAVLKREKERQGFYRDLPERLESLDDLKTLPFTTESDLAQKGGRMLLCSQGEIQRIISEQTSGTTGAGKRVFYTEGDCEHHHSNVLWRLVSLFIREAGLWLPCRFQVLLDWEN